MAHKRNVFIAFGVSILGQAVAALTPLAEKIIVDDVIVNHRRPLAPWLALLIAAGVFGFGAAFVRRYVGGRVSLDVQYDLRNAVYERLQRLDFASHDQMQTGQLVSRANSDVGLLQGLLMFLPIMLGNVVLLVVALVVMVILSPPLTLVALLVLPALLVVTLKLRTTIFPASWDAQQRAGEVAGVVDEAVTGVRVVKGFGQEDRELLHLAGASSDLFSSRMRLVRLQARYTPMLQVVPVLGQVGVLAFGGWLAMNGHLTLGTFLAFSSYMVQLVAPVRMFAVLVAVGQQARAGAERILDLLDANPRIVERADASALPPVVGEVRFDDVRFGYTKSEPVLDGFSLTVPAGSTVALVGASGSGKSTVSLLLPRFYDVAHGSVTIDGIDVRDVTFESLRRQVGVVFEESFLFSDTVRSNIAYGRPDVSDAAVVAAAEAAEAHQFIMELPLGYDTVVGERGLTLSGGQRQRVALARAIITDPRVLILDDATSSIDSQTEEEIHATLRTLMAGRTTLLVAHRRSTLRLADRIVVVDQGRVADSGTHDELMARSDLYRMLLAGPGDDVEGVDASGVRAAPAAAPAAALRSESGAIRHADSLEEGNGVTADAWAAVVSDLPVAKATVTAPARFGPGGGGAGGGNWNFAPTPELLAALDKLPPADESPSVDVAFEAAADAGQFSLRRFVRPYRRVLAVGLGLVVVDTLLTLMGPFLVRRGIDHGVVRGDEGALWIAAIAFLFVALSDWLVTWGYTLVTGRTAERLLYALRIRIFAHLQRLSLDFYDRELGGRIMTRMTTDVEALSQLLQTGLINAVVSLFTCAGVFVFLVLLSPQLALVSASVLPPLFLATLWYKRRSARAYARARESIATVNANLQESLSGVRVAQAYSREDRNITGFRDVNSEYLSARLEAQRLIAVYFPFVLLLADIAAAVVLGAGSAFVSSGTVTAGVVIAFVLYLDQFFSPIQQLSQVFDTWQQAGASMHMINGLMATPSGTPESVSPPPILPGRLQGRLELDDVHFSYPGVAGFGGEALAGVSLTIEPGETIALVGETGAGKSTIVKLVARFYDVGSGRVLIDGVDVRSLDLGAYRRQLGIVPQEAFLFTGTIRDNIAYGRPSASDAEVEAAARAVGAHDFIAALSGGYLAAVSERGRSLSAGQRQLIALARARLVDPAVLLLDEATSNLDLGTEARVQRAMGIVAEGRTTILVAHRLPTARTADRIVVVDGGRIVEVGTHDELLALGGRYSGLWESFVETPAASSAAAASNSADAAAVSGDSLAASGTFRNQP
ncbi:MAG: ATP-binding cassette, subfamily bacterial [Acidimicrobiaceae bacterium]|jgi:ATP-binding cassette subfamily B protein